MVQTVLRLPAVKARTGLSRTSIHMQVTNGTFPKPVKLGLRAIGWLESDIDDWIAQKVAQTCQCSSMADRS
ncbi:MAG: AlpA family transcriptional regulator [Magnetococcales bacterium]|nr:AlpA family transcriptional regulator [Magnetococcales bacterium]